MAKVLCKLVKDDYLEKHMDEYIEMIDKSKFVCKKCGRTANDKDALCKPKKIERK